MTYSTSDRVATYIAYTKGTVDSPDESGQPIRFRSQVFVREFPQVLVKDIRVSGDTSSVLFDAASTGVTGLTHDFSAMLNPADTAHAELVQAHESGRPVTVVLETVRKWRGADGDRVSPTVPIHELRGARPNGRGGDPASTQRHCKNVIAAVGADSEVSVTGEAHSDPSEWSQLRTNDRGQFAPPGWRVVPGGVSDTQPISSSAPTAVPAAADSPDLTAVHQRCAFDHALTMLLSEDVTDDLITQVDRLAKVLLWCADKAHMAVAGGQMARHQASYGETLAWLRMVIDQLSIGRADLRFTVELLASQPDLTRWSRAVLSAATELQQKAADQVQEYLSSTTLGPAGETPPSGGPREDWPAFLDRVVAWGSQHLDRFDAILVATFGTAHLGEVDTAAFGRQLSVWDTDQSSRRAFYRAARAASAEQHQPQQLAAS